MSSELEVTERSGVRWIALNRPESRNGLTEALNQLLIEALQGAARDPNVRCVVVTGKDGCFCSGLDFRAAAARGFADAEDLLRRSFHGLIRAVRAVDKPVIALVDGAAAGFGCDLALACDVRLGTERTRIGEVFARRGLMPDGGATFLLPRLIGVGRALEMMLTGEMIDCDEALRIGLLNRKFSSVQCEAETWAYAERLARGAPLVHARVKQAVYAGLSATFDEALETELRGQVALVQSQDFREGVAAFLEKREPRFCGE